MTKPNGWTGGDFRLFHSDDGHPWIADKNLDNVCWVRREDHARLLASAPDLYEACKIFVEWVTRENNGFPDASSRRETEAGEQAWREWRWENIRMFELSQKLARAALPAAKGERDGCE